MSKKSTRISTEETGSLTGNPFANLDLGNLPPGPELVEKAEPDSKRLKQGRVVLRREKAGRGGKTVTVVDGFEAQFSEAQIVELAKEARQACGCGGTAKGRSVELQGEQINRAREFFTRKGFRVVGG